MIVLTKKTNSTLRKHLVEKGTYLHDIQEHQIDFRALSPNLRERLVEGHRIPYSIGYIRSDGTAARFLGGTPLGLKSSDDGSFVVTQSDRHYTETKTQVGRFILYDGDESLTVNRLEQLYHEQFDV